MVELPVQGIVYNDMLVIMLECILCNIDIVCCHGNQFLVIKGNPQLVSQLHSQFTASASEFTAYCNNLIHIAPPLSVGWLVVLWLAG